VTKPRVLVISYWYPPMLAMGALRVANLVKCLPSHGWQPVVVTISPHSDFYMQTGPLEIPSPIEVHRTRDWSFHQRLIYFSRALGWSRPGEVELSKRRKRRCFSLLGRLVTTAYRQLVCFPDEAILWYAIEYRRIRAIAREVKPKVLFSSSLPNTSHLIAHRLSRELNIPWVAEFRDLWTQNHLLKRAPPLRWIERGLERRVIRRANALVTVSPPLARQLETFHRKPVYVVPNGFDESELHAGAYPQNNAFTITHTGMIYPGKRDPQPLFHALTELLQDGMLSDQEVRVSFYGRKLEHLERLLERYPKIASMISLVGEVSHQEAMGQQRNSTILLLLEWTDPRAKGVYTGKVFEYLAAKRPILAIGPKGGVIEELLNETGAGVLVSTAEEVKTALMEWLSALSNEGSVPYCGDERAIRQYSWQEQARKLANLLDRVVEGG